jgi:hypothetical protein
MARLLGILVVLAGLAAVPAEAGERWPSRARHCDAPSWFCAGSRGLENRLPAPFFGVPSHARSDRPGFGPRGHRPRLHHLPPRHRDFLRYREWRHRGIERHYWRGPVICDPRRDICYQIRPFDPHRHHGGFAWRDFDDHARDRWSHRGRDADRWRKRHPSPGIY